MADLPYELPKASEKLSYKFILDALKEETKVEAASEAAAEAEKAAPAPVVEEPVAAVEAASVAEDVPPVAEQAVCGTEAPRETVPEDEAHESVPMEALSLPAGKKYFRIKEVSKLIGVEPYVLRYWESEFTVVKPAKSGSGHRVYSRRDVEALHLIRHLLHVEKYSIKGAKKKLIERRRANKPSIIAVQQTTQKQVAFLKDVAHQLKELIHLMGSNPGTF